ncbi:hypothetical protein ATK30_6042 [Amycolatopsis echigonensis]|uniref:Uncharacterized protein n=1 Tax=Amycolatopsis echigonensis TaxID=2576905 RepID=A0A2N3WMQ1_9PSEU|nr:hypothetical protein ATK30_6042 [Amycolatopsis niigatensis]
MVMPVLSGLVHGNPDSQRTRAWQSRFSEDSCMAIPILSGLVHGNPDSQRTRAWQSRFSEDSCVEIPVLSGITTHDPCGACGTFPKSRLLWTSRLKGPGLSVGADRLGKGRPPEEGGGLAPPGVCAAAGRCLRGFAAPGICSAAALDRPGHHATQEKGSSGAVRRSRGTPPPGHCASQDIGPPGASRHSRGEIPTPGTLRRPRGLRHPGIAPPGRIAPPRHRATLACARITNPRWRSPPWHRGG